MINKQLVKELEEIVNGSIDPTMFPYQKGNSIRIGSYAIRLNSSGYHKIYDCKQNILIAETFSKTGAVAIARALSKNKDARQKILDIDRELQKWYNDCLFYRYTIRKTDDMFRKDVAETRYDIARDKTNSLKKELDKYIYA
jgi:hypothetical protein